MNEYKFYGQFDPPVDQFIFQRYFPDGGIKGVYVECGACGGLLDSSCKFFEESMGWDGYNLEPSPPNYSNLTANRPNSRNLQIGLSNFDGRVKFTHAIHPTPGVEFGNGSILHTPEHLKELIDRGCSFEEYEIDVITWRSFIARENISRVDLLVLDVEGHEFSVLEGMQGATVLPDIICIEVGHLPLPAIRATLEALGYSYDISSHVNAFFVKNEKLSLFAMRRTSSSKFPELKALEAEHQSDRARFGTERQELFATVVDKDSEIGALKNQLKELEAKHQSDREQFGTECQELYAIVVDKDSEIGALKNHLNDIFDSRSWKMVMMLRKLKSFFK